MPYIPSGQTQERSYNPRVCAPSSNARVVNSHKYRLVRGSPIELLQQTSIYRGIKLHISGPVLVVHTLRLWKPLIRFASGHVDNEKFDRPILMLVDLSVKSVSPQQSFLGPRAGTVFTS